MLKILLISLTLLSSFSLSYADEGMWLLKELNRQSRERMKELGFTFPIDSIYSENNPSLKDAVVIFGPGCTGVCVSEDGLIFTNHHCGFDDIQKLSSLEHDYLKDGFSSQNQSEELRCKGLAVSFLIKMEEITNSILPGLEENYNDSIREEIIQNNINRYLKPYEDNDFLKASITPYYAGNKYYLTVYEVFRDIRLVATPPSSIGKFGDETDNWTWPRHTGDFSVFRVYANKNNKPARYSEENIPYKPKYSVPISLKGYKENDFAMTIGYPGITERYIPSWGISQMAESENKPRILIRGVKQAIWREAMDADDATRIKYAAKYSASANYWKNAIGMNEIIDKYDIINQKRILENQFSQWVEAGNESRKNKYRNILRSLESGYTQTMEQVRIFTLLYETFSYGIEIVRFAYTADHVYNDSLISDKYNDLEDRFKIPYKDYDSQMDKEVMASLMKIYAENVPSEYLPDIYQKIQEKFKGDYNKYADWFFKNTAFIDINKACELVNAKKIKDFKKDPAIELIISLNNCVEKLINTSSDYGSTIDENNKYYMAGLMEMQPDRNFYPDANYSQRLSYGSIQGYSPSDAVYYNHYTTSMGIIEKEIQDDPEFGVQQYILDTIHDGGFGKYANADDSKMYVNFLSNNDITGGNSGSPVLNNNAELIGLAFDGNWESLGGDLLYDGNVQRTISVDTRYILYIIDKILKCPRIINELRIIE